MARRWARRSDGLCSHVSGRAATQRCDRIANGMCAKYAATRMIIRAYGNVTNSAAASVTSTSSPTAACGGTLADFIASVGMVDTISAAENTVHAATG